MKQKIHFFEDFIFYSYLLTQKLNISIKTAKKATAKANGYLTVDEYVNNLDINILGQNLVKYLSQSKFLFDKNLEEVKEDCWISLCEINDNDTDFANYIKENYDLSTMINCIYSIDKSAIINMVKNYNLNWNDFFDFCEITTGIRV